MGYTLALVASLLAFPAHLLGIAGAWLAACSVRWVQGRSSGLCAATFCLIVLAKNYPLSWAWAALAGSLFVGTVLQFNRRSGRREAAEDQHPPRTVAAAETPLVSSAGCTAEQTARPGLARRVLVALALAWLAWGALLWDDHAATTASERIALDPARPIVCWGDSLTAPLDGHAGYPAVLAEQLGHPVVNLGVAGQTLTDAQAQWPQVLAARPQLVVLELGGNDFVRGRTRAAIQSDLRKLILALRSNGCTVVLVEVPRGFLRDPLRGVERELARELDLQLVPDSAIRALVLRSPALPLCNWAGLERWSDDGLHPNVAGCAALAAAVEEGVRAAVETAQAAAE